MSHNYIEFITGEKMLTLLNVQNLDSPCGLTFDQTFIIYLPVLVIFSICVYKNKTENTAKLFHSLKMSPNQKSKT